MIKMSLKEAEKLGKVYYKYNSKTKQNEKVFKAYTKQTEKEKK